MCACSKQICISPGSPCGTSAAALAVTSTEEPASGNPRVADSSAAEPPVAASVPASPATLTSKQAVAKAQAPATPPITIKASGTLQTFEPAAAQVLHARWLSDWSGISTLAPLVWAPCFPQRWVEETYFAEGAPHCSRLLVRRRLRAALLGCLQQGCGTACARRQEARWAYKRRRRFCQSW